MAVFNGTSGDDYFKGGDGADTVTFAGNSDGYRINYRDGVVQIVDIDSSDGDTGTDTLRYIDTLSFADQSYGLEQLETGSPQGNMPAQRGVRTMLDGGGYVVVWSAEGSTQFDYEVLAQCYDDQGKEVGDSFRVNTTNVGDQWFQHTAALAHGGFVVTWTQDEGNGIRMQRFDDSGKALGSETVVAGSHCLESSVSGFDNGDYVVTWSDEDIGIRAQRYDSNGHKVGTTSNVSTGDGFGLSHPASAALADGSYVIVWLSLAGADTSVFSQRYDGDGIKIGGNVQVNTGKISNYEQPAPVMAALGDGGYVIAWTSAGGEIVAQRYDASGSAVGSETRVNTTTAGKQSDSAIAGLVDGGFVVTWLSNDGGGLGVFAQQYDSAGNKVGVEKQINTFTTGNQVSASVTALPDGGFVVTWKSLSGPESGYSQRFDADGTRYTPNVPKITGTTGHDTMLGGVGDQILLGLEGSDTLSGGTGHDELRGGAGSDIYVLADNDLIVESDGAGTDTVEARVSYTLAANVENLTLQGTADLNGTGNSLNNLLIGNAGDNILNGGGGIDQLRGGLGNDTYVISGADKITELADAGTDTVQSSVSYTLVANLENLTLRGVDSIDGTGNADRNVLGGNAANNVLTGLGDMDKLSGGGGNDTLIGGADNDTLTGGSGKDVFRFSGSSSGVDTITDYSIVDDRLEFSDAALQKLVGAGVLAADFFHAGKSNVLAADSNDYFLYETDTGRLFLDMDGNGVGGKVLIAILGTATHPALTASEISVL